MKVNTYDWKDVPQDEKERLLSRSELDIRAISGAVEKIIGQVKARGDEALLEFNHTFDGAPPAMSLKVSDQEFAEAATLVDQKVKDALAYAIENVKRFHSIQKPESMSMMEVRPGILAGERATPIDSTGLYVPRGRGNFPSMLYMLAVPALAAGVPRICVITPPDKQGKVDPACLYAAQLCGVREIYKTGGAHGIAALAYGTESIAPVVKINGPGSMYVTAAKRALSGVVDVGMPAGPSESMILADGGADPRKVALDLLIEAEHGSDSSVLLVTDSPRLAGQAEQEIRTLVEALTEPRRTFVADVFKGYGGIILAETMDEAARIVNDFAPEHLQIQSREPFQTLSLIRNAGEILLGDSTPFSIANYAVGPNAVLPTGGNARTYSAVSVRDFIKYSSVVYVTPNGLEDMTSHVLSLADYEGFVTHGDALRKR